MQSTMRSGKGGSCCAEWTFDLWTLFVYAFGTICRLIQEEKQSTEARAEELESRVGSLEHMNLLARGRSMDRQSPPLSGSSTPNSPNRDYLQKYHTVCKTGLCCFAQCFCWPVPFLLCSSNLNRLIVY